MSVILLAFPLVMVSGYGFQYSADLVFPEGRCFWACWCACCDSLFCLVYSFMMFMFYDWFQCLLKVLIGFFRYLY